MARITRKTQDAAARAERAELKRQLPPAQGAKRSRVGDSFQNFPLNIGYGTNNALSASTYGFNPITRNRVLLEWIHRGSWLGKMAINIVAEDMVREGIDIVCDGDPEDVQGVQNDLVSLGVWTGVSDTTAWSRLYGGAIGVLQIDGQNYESELKPDRIAKGQFRGVVCLDRWMVEPSLNDLVTEQGPHLGEPRFYRVTSDIPGLRMKTVHYSRVIRMIGAKLPYWQTVSENLWGASVLESLYDRMIGFDSASMGASQLAYKSYLRTIKIKGLRQIIAVGGKSLEALYNFVEMMRTFQGIEGVTMLDGDDEFEGVQSANFAGLSDIILQMGQQLSGALQIPLVRMFGQSPAGLNSTGESDLRTYYDGIHQKQKDVLAVPMRTIVRATALSGGWNIGDNFQVVFRPLWQLDEVQKSEVSDRDTTSVISAESSGLVSQQTALKELKQQSKTTGRWTNVTDEDIAAASDELAPRGQDAIDQETDAMKDRAETVGDQSGKSGSKPSRTEDSAVYAGGVRDAWKVRDLLPVSEICGVPVAVECLRGTIRRGVGEDGTPWESVMPADYGYIRRAPSAEGPTEWLDCFLGPERYGEASGSVYVIDGYEPLGRFDEHKVMLGFGSARDALQCYHDAYADGRRAGAVTPMSTADLIAWYSAPGAVTRPIGERNLRLAAGDAA